MFLKDYTRQEPWLKEVKSPIQAPTPAQNTKQNKELLEYTSNWNTFTIDDMKNFTRINK